MPDVLENLRVVLVAARNPLNIGAAARAMSNFGVAHLRVVNPYEVAFREARSAIGASAVLTAAEEYKSVGDAVADCVLVVGTTAIRHRELQHPVHRLEYGGRLIRKELASARVALLFGSEKVGLSNQELSHCHWLLHIPTCEQNISMNLGQAVAVCLYELGRVSAKTVKRETVTRASAGELERITALLLDALQLSGYVGPVTAAPAGEKVRRMIRRLELQSPDAEVLLGMLRQILWKLRAEGERGASKGG